MVPKKKIQTGILLAGVLLVWGVIAVRFSKDFWSSGKELSKVQDQQHVRTDTLSDMYTLHDYTRDPFLSLLTDTASVATEDTPVVKQTVVISRPVVTLPEYCGTVQNKEERMAILRVQDKFHFLKRSERLNGLQLTSIADDSITLAAEGVRYRVGLKHNIEDNRQAGR